MLESLVAARAQARLHRYASVSPDDLDFLRSQGLDREGINEILGILRGRGVVSLDAVLDGPFTRKGGGRYSNGDFSVFYSALEPETARVEVVFWYGRRAFGDGTKSRTAYYDHVQCDFEGLAKDLRGKRKEWPLLVSGDTRRSYPFCNRLGAEAVAEGLDGLYAPSARQDSGTCVPVFRRVALSNPTILESAAFAFDPSSGGVSISTRSADAPSQSREG